MVDNCKYGTIALPCIKSSLINLFLFLPCCEKNWCIYNIIFVLQFGRLKLSRRAIYLYYISVSNTIHFLLLKITLDDELLMSEQCNLFISVVQWNSFIFSCANLLRSGPTRWPSKTGSNTGPIKNMEKIFTAPGHQILKQRSVK